MTRRTDGVTKLLSDIVALGRASIRCRHAALGSRVRAWGRPRIIASGQISIGDRVQIHSKVAMVELVAGPNGHLEIGERTVIMDGTHISAEESVRIGARCHIARGVSILDSSFHGIHPEARNQPPQPEAVTIGDNVWLSTRVMVLPGVTIGCNAVAAAGAVVTTDVPVDAIVAGIPARIIGSVRE